MARAACRGEREGEAERRRGIDRDARPPRPLARSTAGPALAPRDRRLRPPSPGPADPGALAAAPGPALAPRDPGPRHCRDLGVTTGRAAFAPSPPARGARRTGRA